MQAQSVEAVVARARSLAANIGPEEGAGLQAAAELILGVLPQIPPSLAIAANRILWRAGFYNDAETLGDLAALGRLAAQDPAGDGLVMLLARARTNADRSALVDIHRAWAAGLERLAAQRPLRRPPRDAARRPLRLGFLSSDLRHHVVAWFAQPLFQHLDPRFELFVYSSFRGEPDVVQRWIAGRCAYRILAADDAEAAQAIADDDLDMLIDLGGPTAGNRPGLLAWRPAPLQAAWLGYPHSLGLAEVDAVIADPWLIAPRSELMAEQPLVLPNCWICMSPAAFQPEPPVALPGPLERTSRVTFGTANDSAKFSPELLRTWARVVAAVPGSRFLIVRPEAGAPAFRENVARYFAELGVADRLDFHPVRGAARAGYGMMDIALDTFPSTGGTSTCEALWMGVPTVSLVGEAMFERLGWSILNNAGLAELAANTVEDYVRIAVDLAAAPARVAELRRTLRARIAERPLGQPQAFTRDFYDLVADAIAAQAR